MPTIEAVKIKILAQDPTAEQRQAIFANDREYLLRASPGSGKTWTSCRRFLWRGINWEYKSGGLALLSFTNSAIREFHEAAIGIGRRELLLDPNYTGTFDSFVERFIITPFGHLVANIKKRPKLFIAPRPGDRNNKKLMVWVESGTRKTPVPAWDIIPFIKDEKIAYKTSRQYGEKELDFKAGQTVVQEFFKLGFYTHSQRVFLGCFLLLKRPHIALCLAKRFPEIIVDEAQDSNIWLLTLLRILRKHGSKITLIGDPDQCIYEFSMADATSLPKLQEEWNIPELPLNYSFRCNEPISLAVRNISGNTSFTGCKALNNTNHRPFIFREPSTGFENCINRFQQLLIDANLHIENGAILCRGRKQLETIKGKSNYLNLKGLTQKIAQASFYRDINKDYRKATLIVESILREITTESNFWEFIDDNPDSELAEHVCHELWKFTKSIEQLPALSNDGDVWVDRLKKSIGLLLSKIGICQLPKLGQKFKKTGLDVKQKKLPLFQPETTYCKIRQETIHQVKGESIDGVLLIGSIQFFNSVLKDVKMNCNTEDRRLAYVAMTRARHTLLIGLPAKHYDKFESDWQDFGFQTLT